MVETYQFDLCGLIISGSFWVVNGDYRTTCPTSSIEVYPNRHPIGGLLGGSYVANMEGACSTN